VVNKVGPAKMDPTLVAEATKAVRLPWPASASLVRAWPPWHQSMIGCRLMMVSPAKLSLA
jgi:hypothetical protein